MSSVTWWNIVVIAGSIVLLGMLAAFIVWRVRVRSAANLSAMEFVDPSCELEVQNNNNNNNNNGNNSNNDGTTASVEPASIVVNIATHEGTATPGKIIATIETPSENVEVKQPVITAVSIPLSLTTPVKDLQSNDSQSESEDECENSPMLPESEQEVLDDDDMMGDDITYREAPPLLNTSNFNIPPPPVICKALPETSPLKVETLHHSQLGTPSHGNRDTTPRMSAQVKLHALEQQFFPLPSPVAIPSSLIPESPRQANGSLSHTKQSKLPTFNISVNHNSNGQGIDVSMIQEQQQQHLPPVPCQVRRNSVISNSTPIKRDLEGSMQISTPLAGLPPMPMLRKRSDSIGSGGYYNRSQIPASPMRKISIPSSPMAGSSSSPFRKSLNGSVWSSVSARFAGSHLPGGGVGSMNGGSRAGSSLGSYIHHGSGNGTSIQQPRYSTPPQVPLSTSHYRTGMITKPLPQIPQQQQQQQHPQPHSYKCIENMHVIPRPNVTTDGSLDRGVPVGGMGAVLKKNPFYFSNLMSDWERRSGRNQSTAPSPIPHRIVDGAFDISDGDWADLDEANRLREGVDIASSSYWTAFLGEVERLRK